MTLDRDDHIYLTKLAEQAERYEEMVEYVKKAVAEGADLNVEERNLLSVAYKNVIGSRRAAWRILSSIEQKEERKTDGRNRFNKVKEYRQRIEEEMSKIASEVLALLDDRLVPAASTTEAKVFFNKMKGDYHRYISEFSSGQDRKDAAENALVSYKVASEAAGNLPPTHPIRLGLALNFSVFYYEILNSPDRARKLAKAAFDEAIAELDTLSEESYKDSTLIMQLLRDNLTLWTSEAQQDAAGNDDGNKVQDAEANE